MKNAGKILVTIAGILLLLHTLFPHAHHGQLNGEQQLIEQSTASTLYDFLQLAFHFNPGEHHLEEFQPSDDDVIVHLPFLMALLQWAFIAPIEERQDDPVPAADLVVNDYCSYHQLSFRGPPQLV